MTVRILAAAIATALGVAYFALAITDRETAVTWMPLAVAITLLAVGIDAITRHGKGPR